MWNWVSVKTGWRRIDLQKTEFHNNFFPTIEKQDTFTVIFHPQNYTMVKYFSIIVLLMASLIGKAQSANTEVQPSTKTQQPVAGVKVKVFPNPATNVVNVLGLKNTSKADITIMDIYGNTVLAYQWAIRRNALNIPISTLVSGAYIIRIHSEEQQIRTKFYKQH